MPTPPSSEPTASQSGGGSGDVLGRRALNRALLARQLLLRRSELPATEAVEHLVGLQAQAPNPPYVGLWTRLDGFRPDDLARSILDRSVVRVALIRSTIHLVTARDCLLLRPVVQPALDRDLWGNHTHGPPIRGMDTEALVAAGRALLEERPRTGKEIGALLAERWPGRPPASLAYAVRNLVPLIQVPPRGVGGTSGPAAHTTAEAWLGRPLDPDSSPDGMVMRYLGALGPATVGDAQAWSGLTRLRGVFERLRPSLCVFRDERGGELFDLPDAPRPDPDTPAPPRLLPEFDNLILSHADRTRVISDEHRKRISARYGMVPGAVLVGGFVRGTWKARRTRKKATVEIQPFEPLPKNDRDALAEEAEKLARFLAEPEGAEEFEVRFGGEA